MQIVNPGLAFNGQFSIRRRTERIIFHHSATNGDVSAATIHQWHRAQGWKGIGYHYVIRTSGLIEIGRPENVVGSHSGPAGNSTGIGVCVAGNFMSGPPVEAQVQAAIELSRDIFSRNGVLQIQGHREVMATACPGAYFPLDRIKLGALREAVNPLTTVIIAGQPVQGYLYNGRAYIPIRQSLGILGVPYTWEAATNSAVVRFYKIKAHIVGGTGYAWVHDIAAATDRQVTWDQAIATARII